MSEKKNTPKKVENMLLDYYETPRPDSSFLAKLDRQMQLQVSPAKTATRKSGWQDRLFGSRMLVPALGTLAVLLLLLFGNPKSVVARIQEILGYVPGFGFVELNAVRILPEPVSMTQGGVTMTVQQVVAGPEETIVVIRGEGLPSEQQIGDWGRAYFEQNGDFSLYETDARLVLEDGTEITEQYFQAAPWDGFFTFPALPQGTRELVFKMPEIPGIPSQYVPGDWSFDIRLDYVELPESFNLPEPQPISASAELLEGINIVVLDAVYSSSEISLRIKLSHLPEGWSTDMFSLDADLKDDLGNSYNIVYLPNSGRGINNVFTVNFRAIDPRAEKLTLQINALFLNVPLEGERIRVDFGDHPAAGQTFAVDQVLNVLDVPVHVNTIRLETGTEMSMDEDPQPFGVTRYVFDMAADVGDGRVLISSIDLMSAIRSLFPLEVQSGGMATSGMDPDTGEFSQLMTTFWVPEGVQLPKGVVEISPSAATLQLNGPFEVNWTIR